MKWKILQDNASIDTEYSIPNDAREIYVQAYLSNGYGFNMTFIPIRAVSLITGSSGSSATYMQVDVLSDITKIRVHGVFFFFSGVSYANDSEIKIYYR